MSCLRKSVPTPLRKSRIISPTLSECRPCGAVPECYGRFRIKYIWDNGTDLDTSTLVPAELNDGTATTVGWSCVNAFGPKILSSGDNTGTGSIGNPIFEYVYLDVMKSFTEGDWNTSVQIICRAHWYNKVYTGDVRLRAYWECHPNLAQQVIKSVVSPSSVGGCASSDGSSQMWTITINEDESFSIA